MRRDVWFDDIRRICFVAQNCPAFIVKVFAMVAKENDSEISPGSPNKRMNRSRLAFANFGTRYEFNSTFGPVILGVRRAR